MERQALPLIPVPFRLVVRQVRTKEGYVTDPVATRQLEVLRGLLENADALVIATDAGREGELVSLTLVTDRLPKKLKKPSVILITVLSLIFSAILFKYGMDKVITQLENGKRTFVLNWPEWIFWSFVPIGAGCMILHFIEYCLDVCFGNNNDKEDK